MTTHEPGLRSPYLRRVLEYWRASLADSDRMNVEFQRPFPFPPGVDEEQKDILQAVAVPQGQIAQGRLSVESTKRLIELARIQHIFESPKPSGSKDPYSVSILICAVSAALQPSHSKYHSRLPKHLTPLWIPAICFLEPEDFAQSEALIPTGMVVNELFRGRIEPHPERQPFIPRQYLEPMDADSFWPTIGTIEEVDAFLGNTVFPPAESRWKQIWDYSVGMLQTVAGNYGLHRNSVTDFAYQSSDISYKTERIRTSEAPRKSEETASFILIDSQVAGPSRYARKLYDFLLEPAKQVLDLKLLEAYAEKGTSTPDPVLGEHFRNIVSEARHLGQMTGHFPLSPSQREALHHTLCMDEGEILAVNGPPGTGKTTLIQSVVASLWVERALAQAAPPLVFAASSNNQAVTNIISSFGAVAGDGAAGPRELRQDGRHPNSPSLGRNQDTGLKFPRPAKWLLPSVVPATDQGNGSPLEMESDSTRAPITGDGREIQSTGLIPMVSGGLPIERRGPPAMGASSTDSSDHLSSRWLPKVRSFGLYLPAISRRDKAESHGFQWSSPEGGGFPRSMFIAFKERKMEAYFRNACSLFFQTDFSDVSQCLERIHSELTDCISAMRGGLNAFHLCVDTERELTIRYDPEGGMDAYGEHLAEESARLDFDDSRWRGEIENLESLRIEAEREHGALKTKWLNHIVDQPWFHTAPIVSFFFRAQASAYRRRFFAENRIDVSVDAISPRFFEAVLDRLRDEALRAYRDRIDECRQKLDTIAEERQGVVRFREKLDADRQRLFEVRSAWQKWRETYVPGDELPDQELDSSATETLECRLDVTLRHRAFLLATHYWEARWLLDAETTKFKDNDHDGGLFNEYWQKKRWERYAMLTPCFVTTFFMLPKFIQRSMKIDLLIVDEAGQVIPEIAGASFALAKTALVVGDSRQISPVWNIPREVDLGNLARFGLLPEDEEERMRFQESRSASAGSVLRIAQNCSRYQKIEADGYRHERGMFLAEHRRCTDEIIDFCNRLAYHGRLIPKRGSHVSVLGEGYPLPSFGFAGVQGKTRGSGSKFNIEEANAINEWLNDNWAALVDWYPGKTIEQIIAVVTPFKRQASVIRASLDTQLENVTVGTIHVLQGAERNIILFSYVYDSTPTYFLDRTVNLLNVAVSRAKDSFIVFGNRDALGETTAPMTGLLREFVFRDPNRNRIPRQVPFRDTGGRDGDWS